MFLSSTASDMTACREKVRDTILRLEQLPIGMETFTPQPTTPVADCMKEAAEADVVIVMVAYRYGSPPTVDLGGDGKRSVTWLEVEAAKQAEKPVYAYLIDPQAEWGEAKETDLLNTEPEAKYAEILGRIRGLKEFKDYLNANCTWALFTTFDDLAAKVATKLATHILDTDPYVARTAKVWLPRVCYPLQPAPHFQGRARLLNNLAEWGRSKVSPDRVISLVAMGGTGKTALAEQVLRGIGEEAPAGLLVWSFYENPRTDEFLRTACHYFTGEMPTSAGGLFERLQVALSGDEPHLLVLDGLERVQSEGTSGRPRGELEDPQLRRLLRWLAAGQGTRTRALVTSRFALVDLDNWKGAGHREERLEDLEPIAARAVLRGWGVNGDDSVLDELAIPLGYHALSIAVLGSYLGKLCGGDPQKAPSFDRGELSAIDPKAAKLNRILTHYAEQLPDDERDLMARLSTFPRGVTTEFLSFLIDAGGQIAGALAGYKEVRLLTLLERLRMLGLVFRYASPSGNVFTAHPFLRDYFRGLLVVAKPEEIHAAVCARLEPSLEKRPGEHPTDSQLLDKYELLIEHTRLAGREEDAFQLYQYGIGGGEHLSFSLGDHSRGLRIVSAFSRTGSPDFDSITHNLSAEKRGELLRDWGIFAQDLGDLKSARRAFDGWVEALRKTSDKDAEPVCHFTTFLVEKKAGRNRAALDEALFLNQMSEAKAKGEELVALALSMAFANVGNVTPALELLEPLLDDYPPDDECAFVIGAWPAEFKRTIGATSSAAEVAHRVLDASIKNGSQETTAKHNLILGFLLLSEDPSGARQHLEAARKYASFSGSTEVQLRSYDLAAEIARSQQVYDLASGEAEAGIHLADTCGFGNHAIDLRLTLARVHLDAGDPKSALQQAREALDRALDPECQYAWGEADSLHLCGIAHARLGELELARQRLTEAIAKREALTHPGLAETRAELARISG